MAREIRNLWIGQQALFALVDVLANTFLTCIPEPPRDVRNQAVALGKIRHEQISQKRCMAMMGDSQAAMAEWLSRGHENRERAGVPRAGGPERRGKNELFAWPPTISTVDRVPALEVCARFRRAGRMTSPARLSWTWTHALTRRCPVVHAGGLYLTDHPSIRLCRFAAVKGEYKRHDARYLTSAVVDISWWAAVCRHIGKKR